MSTPNRTEINRGKQRSSVNALRHRLTGQTVVMLSEDREAYSRLLAAFTEEYRPKGAAEVQLVRALADASWRLNRVAALEANILTFAAARQPGRLASAPSQVQEAMALAASYETQSKALANLSLHSQRLSDQFEKTVAHLRDLQKPVSPTSTSWKCMRKKENPTTRPKMASFLQCPNSTGPSASAPRPFPQRGLRNPEVSVDA